LLEAVRNANLDPKTKNRIAFFTKQYIDAMSPSNWLLTNPEVLKMAIETNGESIASGLRNLVQDIGKGRISMTDEAAFEVGRNIAATPGDVVFENDLIQLIHYQPIKAQVYERPMLFVPPCINKFYIMDLQPENSLVRYTLEQGYNLFLVSWRNISKELQHLTWDDYIGNGVIKAVEVTHEITGQEKINALGFCVGGTLLASALAVLRARKLDPVASLTLMTCLLEFSDVGDIGHYIDRHFVERRERTFRTGGVVPGKELAMAFSSLRANDLLWSYVVNNYLKGKTPEAFDLLYWNSDGTNLPGPMFAYYLRNTYHDNNLVKPNRLSMCGTPVDLGRVDTPTFAFAAIEDHIVPWRAAYASARYLSGKAAFVLGASGHIAGSINPASKNRRNYWVAGQLEDNPDDWFRTVQYRDGTWWTEWTAWLKNRSGKRVLAPKQSGATKYPPIEPAPGRYVRERAM
jgi:polyhydroxyalkanoate synthase